MFPILFSLGSFTLHTFSIFLLLAFLMMTFAFWRRGREEHYAEDELMDALILALLYGALWSRIGFIAFHFQYFGLNPIKWFDIVSIPGTLSVAGIAAGFSFLYRYAKRQKWNAFEVLDFASIGVALGLAVVWLGSLFAGTNFGHPTSLPWGMTFPNVFDKRHPTQLYGFALYLLLFFFLSWAESRYRTFSWYRAKHSAQTGFLFCMFCIVYGLVGVFLSFLMPNELVIQGFALDLPLRVAIFLFGAVLLYIRSGRGLLLKKR